MDANIVKNLDNAAAYELKWQKAFKIFKVKIDSDFTCGITQKGELGFSK